MYAKFIDGKFVRGRFGMTAEEAVVGGFKPVVLTKPPEVDETHIPVEWLEETETEIVRHWNVVEVEPEPEPEPDDSDKAEAYDILMGVTE